MVALSLQKLYYHRKNHICCLLTFTVFKSGWVYQYDCWQMAQTAQELFDSLKHFQARVTAQTPNSNSLENASVAGLHEVQHAISQAIQSYAHIQDLYQHLTRSQEEIDQTVQQVTQVQDLFSQALNVIKFNLDQLMTSQGISPDHKGEIEGLQKNILRLENLVKDLMQQNHSLQISDKTSTAPKSEGVKRILDRISLASKVHNSFEKRSGRCLIVDPNPNTAESIQRRLAHEGHEALTTMDLSVAQDMIAKGNVDIIIIDIMVAKTDFKDLVNTVLQHDSSYIPTILTGSLGQLDEMGPLLEAGAEDFLIKPVNAVLLKSRVYSCMDKKTAHSLREEQMRESSRVQEELREAITHLTDGFVAFGSDRKLLMYNDRVFEVMPHLKSLEQSGELYGMSLERWLQGLLETGIIDFSQYCEKELEDAHNSWYEDRLNGLSTPANSWEEHSLMGEVFQFTSYRTGDGSLVLIIKDDTERYVDQQRLAYMAYHDALTGLANREQFFTRLRQEIAQPSATEKGLAILFMDLDGFKAVNDQYGHDLGDWLLVQVSERLRNCIRDRDIVSRFGGDEFAAIIHNGASSKTLVAILERIINVISSPFYYNDIAINIGISIGVSIYPVNSPDIVILVTQADAAMYSAKQSGRGTYRFYSNDFEILKPTSSASAIEASQQIPASQAFDTGQS